MVKITALNIVLTCIFSNSAFAKIVEVSPFQRRYYLVSKIELEAIPDYDIEDKGTSPTKKTFHFESVLFSKEYPIGDSSNFDSKENVISYNSGKSAKDKEIRKQAETIHSNDSEKRNREFKHKKNNKILRHYFYQEGRLEQSY